LVERIPLPGNAVPLPSTAYTKDLDAYDSYLKGRFFSGKGTVQDFHKALPYFEDAIRRDPSYALAYAALADVYGNLVGNEAAKEEWYAKARSSALRALVLDESLAEAHASLGFVKAFHDYDHLEAEEAFQRALSLNPNSVMSRDWYSYYLLFFPRWDEAIAMQRRAVKLDPLAIIISADLGLVLVHAGRWDEAIGHLQEALTLDPGSAFLLEALGLAYAGKGMYPEALAAFKKRIDSAGKDPEALGLLAYASALSGNTSGALQSLKEMELAFEPGHAWNFATAYMGLATRNERYRNEMFAWLNSAHEERAMDLVDISSVRWESFRSDPRMITLRNKLRLPTLNNLLRT
jgi:tetratricopeptide (TPR) repeat protein